MTTLREAAQQALEALESLFNWQVDSERGQRCGDAVVALKDALAEPDRAQKMRDAGYTRRPTLREMAEPEPPIGKASTDVGVPVYVVKKAEPVQEPVCDKDPRGCYSVRCQLGRMCKHAAPPQRKPLTDQHL